MSAPRPPHATSSSSSSLEDSPFQRANPYNVHLPYAVEAEADRFLAEIKRRLKAAVQSDAITDQAIPAVVNLHKYIILYGLRFTLQDHVLLIKICFQVLLLRHLSPLDVENVAKILNTLLKKTYLIHRSQLTLPWRPLFDLYYYWEESAWATRGLIKPNSTFKNTLHSLLTYTRGYYSEDATEEMLREWKPMLCPHDTSMVPAMKYFKLFLPTKRNYPPERTYHLWLDEFLALWKAYSNSPSWEVDLFGLLSRLCYSNIGRLDWTPHADFIFTRIMNALNIPVTFASTGVKLPFGLSSTSSYNSIARWLVSAIDGGDGRILRFLDRLFLAIESYFYPVNMTSASDSLHSFIFCICDYFCNRVHNERYNQKWECQVEPSKRLTDEDIRHFVRSIKPIAFHILFSNYDGERRTIFRILSLLAPDLIIPPLLEKLQHATETLTEPHRFTACIGTISAVARSLVENYPEEVIGILTSLLPGLDVNDIEKCADNFILMSDTLEMIWLVDFSRPESRSSHCKLTDVEAKTLAQTSLLEDFALQFTDKCLTLIENTSRLQTRHEIDVMEEDLNDEELAVDCAVADTFSKMLWKASPEIFELVFNRVKRYIQNRIMEAYVSGSILAGMCKSLVSVQPVKALEFFIPHLCQRIEIALSERVASNKSDQELQFSLLLLSEVISIRSVNNFFAGGEYLLIHIRRLCEVLDKVIRLQQKEEYELAFSILQNMLYTLVHIRIIESPTTFTVPKWDRDTYAWAKCGDLKTMKIQWYIPTNAVLASVQTLVDKYLAVPVDELNLYMSKKKDLEKEDVLRNLRMIFKLIQGCSELLEEIGTDQPRSCVSNNMADLSHLKLTFRGRKVRVVVSELIHELLHFLLKVNPHDTESLTCITNLYDTLLFSFGLDEDEIYEHMEEHRTLKNHRDNPLVKSKKHLESILIERILIQHESHLWLKSMVVEENLPKVVLLDLLELSISLYSDVRSYSQDILYKILTRVPKFSHQVILPRLLECLQDCPNITHQMFKGALYLISNDKLVFFHNWSIAAKIYPALIQASHSDKPSIVELLKDISTKINRYYNEYALYSLPIRSPRASAELLELLNSNRKLDQEMETDHEICPDFLALEKCLPEILARTDIHWRQRQMATGLALLPLVPGHLPAASLVDMWLQALISDDRVIRNMAFLALESILKIAKIKRKRTFQSIENPKKPEPGVRKDNEFLQFRWMKSEELEVYWEKPFLVKGNQGFYEWPKPVKMRLPDDSIPVEPNHVHALFLQSFSNKDYVSKYIQFNKIEHKKGEDTFSSDKALFLSNLFENYGDSFLEVFLPHVKELAVSAEDSHQRVASELVYGMIRGSRFWTFKKARKVETELKPLLKTVLGNITTETVCDWELCINGSSSRSDSNRIQWFYEVLLDQSSTQGKGAFLEATHLKLLNKALSLNWKLRLLYQEAFESAKKLIDHPYNKVRVQTSYLLATLLSMDSSYGDEGWSMGQGFPSKASLVQEVLPKLNLNVANPQFEENNVIANGNGHTDGPSNNVGANNTDVDMDEDDELETQSDRILQTVSQFLCFYIQSTSSSVTEELFEFLPFLCQFLGTESNKKASQTCLKALCFLSVSTIPTKVLPKIFEVMKKISHSPSRKAKMSMLEYLQTFLFTNFMSLCDKESFQELTEELIVHLMADDAVQVRQKAARVLGGLIHCHFFEDKAQLRLIREFRSKIRAKMQRKRGGLKPKIKFVRDPSGDKTKLAEFHSGILGLCAFVEAYPYDVPKFMPEILIELEKHLNDQQPIPKTIKKTMQDFKRTHQDNWSEHKLKFTEDQLTSLTNLLVSPNYYA